MGITDDLGIAGKIPTIDLTGFFSNTWMWVLVIVIIGMILIIGVGLLLFFLTYKKKIILFENISGQGYQPVLKTRARIIKLGVGGEEILKTLIGGHYCSAYGRKMGKNTYWYAKGQDGYWYNIVVGDLDSKQAMLDIDPIDRDVRMFHVALDRLSHQTYDNKGKWDRALVFGGFFLILVTLLIGLWFIVGKVGEAMAPLTTAGENAVQIQEANDKTLTKLDSLIRALGHIPKELEVQDGGSGLVEAG